MKIKVCGMTNRDNVAGISALRIDYLGFIFYEPSPRYLDPDKALQVVHAVRPHVQKVGVFVNAPQGSVLDTVARLKLDYVQLHGTESPKEVRQLHAAGLRVIKAFAVDDSLDWDLPLAYAPYCAFFLFDTATPRYGGSGRKFDWSKLTAYRGPTPFFLSGGIGVQDADALRSLKHPAWCGIDLNSGMEIRPGVKDVERVRKMIQITTDEEYFSSR